MSNDALFEFFVRDGESLYQHENIIEYLEAFTALGYRVFSENEEAAISVWGYIHFHTLQFATLTTAENAVDQQLIFTPGISAQSLDEIDQFCTNRWDDLELQIYSTVRSGPVEGLHMSLQIAPESHSIFFMIMMKLIATEERQKAWDSVLHMTYAVWHPIYGYPSGSDSSLTITRDEALTLPIEYLFDENYWGPEIVNQFGLQRILATPDVHIEELDDDGVYIERTGQRAGAYLGLKNA